MLFELNPAKSSLSDFYFYSRSYRHVRGKCSKSLYFTPSDRLHPLCRSLQLRLLLCPTVTLSTLRRESPASVQTCQAIKDRYPPCWPPSGRLQFKALSCPCSPAASCPVTPASGTSRTSTSSSPLCPVGAASTVRVTSSHFQMLYRVSLV